MDFSKNKGVAQAQRHLLAAVVVMRSKSISPDDYASIIEFVDYVTNTLQQQVKKPKPKKEVKYFD